MGHQKKHQKDHWGNKYYLPFGILIIIIISSFNTIFLSLECRYSIAESSFTNKSGWVSEFKVNNKIYYSSGGTFPAGSKHFVKYSVYFPSINKLLTNVIMSDSIQTAPPNGWAKLPIE